MKNIAVMSGHLYKNPFGRIDIEELVFIHDDYERRDTFDDVGEAIIDAIDMENKDDHYFIVVVKSEWTKSYHPEFGTEWEVEHEVIELNSIEQIKEVFSNGTQSN